MNVPTRTFALSALVLLVAVLPVTAQQAPAATSVSLSSEQMERFLLTARVVSTRRAGDGVTNSLRATLTDGALTHDAHVQTVDEARNIFETPRGIELNFKDTYRYNIAAYRLARTLGMTNVPMSVERVVQGKPAAVTWWIDDVVFDEAARAKTNEQGPNPSRFAMQVHMRLVFDELIQNTDRNLGNMVWSRDWTMWLIDHTRAFRLSDGLARPERIQRCDRALLTAIRGLTKESLKQAVGQSLTSTEIDAVMDRAQALARLFDRLIAQKGEAAVMFTYPR